jgi:glyoxylase-like metal-dependent hydrolase (beta-lactamase superfamily II)
MYRPTIVPIVDALAEVGVDERDVVAIVNSHLHFDHCGQNRALPSVPVWVQTAEYEMVEVPRFTIADWARLPDDRRRTIDGDVELAAGVRIIATPGHTPGHQSLLIDDERGRTVIAGQCCYTCGEFVERALDPDDVHDESWYDTGIESIARLHRLEPDAVHFSHDRAVFRVGA